jgi:hypothetical protein
MPRLNDIDSNNEVVSLLLYGNTKTGKTMFVGSAGDRTVIISPSFGLATLGSPLYKHMYGCNPIIEIVDEEPLPTVAEGFDKVRALIELYLENPEIDTIVVEDVTNLRAMAMNKGLELNGKLLSGAGAPRTSTLAKMKKLGSSAIIAKEVGDYTAEMGFIESLVKNAVTFAKEAKKNFIMTAHERCTYKPPDKMGGIRVLEKIAPGFTGQTFPDEVVGFFDLIWHTEVLGSGDRTFYQIRTAGSASLIAGTRAGAGLFPTIFEKQPSFLDVVNCIRTGTIYQPKK